METTRRKEQIQVSLYRSSRSVSMTAMIIVAVLELIMLGYTVANPELFGSLIWRYRSFYILKASGAVGPIINSGIFFIFQIVLGTNYLRMKMNVAERIVEEKANALMDVWFRNHHCILRQRTATNARPNGRRARGQRPRCAKLTATVSGLYFLPT